MSASGLEAARDRLAEAIRSAAQEQGVPNTFGPRELHVLYGGPSQLVAGRIGRNFVGSLNDAVNALILTPKYEITYRGRRFHVRFAVSA